MASKRILGLDLGVSSIGWAIVNEDENNSSIVDMGVRIIPLTTDEKDEFSSGNAISKNQKRTQKRTQRKGYDRYQLRRKKLVEELSKRNFLPNEDLFKINALQLYGLRNKATKDKVELPELGRIFLHLNQKRGYKSTLKEENTLNKKEGDYVKAVKGRHQQIKDLGITVGQYFYNGLLNDIRYRIKEQVFPREAYIEEFNLIYKVQQNFYPEILTDTFHYILLNETIYYQRPLKSQKGLVSICEFEGKKRININTSKEVFVGPKVAPRSSPLSQVTKIWESINSIKLKGKRGQEFEITIDQKHKLFDYLDNNEKLSESQLFKILGLNKEDGFSGNSMTKSGIKGNETKVSIRKILQEVDGFEHLLRFNLTENSKYYLTDYQTGEQIEREIVDSDFEFQPLYQLWHCIYSLSNETDLIRTLVVKFKLPELTAVSLAKLDFTKQGFSNKSAKCMRKILPFLKSGLVYSDAMEYAGYNHSNSISKAENEARKLLNKIPLLNKNSLRQPVVEKILNQMINIVNAIIEKYGRPDEIRVELARELKSSKDERSKAESRNNLNEKINKTIAKKLESEYGVKVNKRNIDKMKMYEELDGMSLYTGKKIELAAFLRGDQVDVEHILPKSRIFDDSLQNKTICEQSENRAKGNKTAYDYMQSKSEEEFNSYIERVEMLFKLNKITKAKRDKLLTPASKIPDDFIERQLRQTQYIAKKSTEILKSVCFNVYATSGQVTDYLKHQWGWDEVLMNLRINTYKQKGFFDLIEQFEVLQGGQIKIKERIKGWTKRDDHRHHAIDALTIACTKQALIQKLNKLNQEVLKKEGQSKTDALKEELGLKEYVEKLKPFKTKEVEEYASRILVSFKAGKKAAVNGVRKARVGGKLKIAQTGIIIPRAELHEEAIYGNIFRYQNTQLKSFSVKKYKLGVGSQGFVFTGKETYSKTLKLNKKTNFTEEIVVDKIKQVLNSIVDSKISKLILDRLNRGFKDGEDYRLDVNKALSNFKNLDNDPLYFNEKFNIKINSIRMFTGLTSTKEISNFNEKGELTNIKSVLPKNNHHLAIYKTENGFKDSILSVWDAVQRYKFKLPIIIEEPSRVWNDILENSRLIPEDVLNQLPNDNWQFVLSMQQNEMFVFGINKENLINLINTKDFKSISENLYRFQKTESGYKAVFRHHLATRLDNKMDWKGFSSFNNFDGVKVKLNCLGHLKIL
jgi:CRISPR-associated endonuclease Csn1